ncbi:acyltransferase [Vibrio hangzhouensis]|uniref:Surface polysaccharide O-acyltransferase, integral membrane enzyme n=1 Tax=Vibrio hangzhouensis TaxID=462991 RepID=A0A1H5RN09_9VIBR|nr:acyltransferase family protein [Vibrio hangzhouensis]SEF39753.1 Surface polysaccharide O-acyltransferase, integral membrane enzyme [Vibrio hangzhouensis]
MSKTRKIASLETARVLAFLAVVLIHSQFLMSLNLGDSGEPWFGYIVNQLARFAVPLFFLISGYLIQPKLYSSPFPTASQYALPLMRLWLIWSVIYLLVPFNLGIVVEQGYLTERQGYWDSLMVNPLNSILEGGLVHLWFLPSLVMAVYIIAFAVSSKKAQWVLVIGALLYLYGLMGGSYQVLTGIEAPVFTRNGPFFSLLMVSLGCEIRSRSIRLDSGNAIKVMLVGLMVHFAEASVLHHLGYKFSLNDYLVGTVMWAVGFFLWLLANPGWGNGLFVSKIASRVLPLYVAHLLVIIAMFNVCGILGLNGLLKDMVVLVGALALSYRLVCLLERTPLSFMVRR